jgi:uncharacterized protein YlbG (UPF0298 family)
MKKRNFIVLKINRDEQKQLMEKLDSEKVAVLQRRMLHVHTN